MYKWIQKSIKKHGAFTQQARRAGLSVPAFTKRVISEYEKAREKKIRSPFNKKTYRRAILARTFSHMRKK